MNERLQHDIEWLHGLLDEVAPPSPAESIVREIAASMVGPIESDDQRDRIASGLHAITRTNAHDDQRQ